MQTFDQHLLDLLRANKISVETALAAASNPTDFQTKLALEGDVGTETQGDEPRPRPLRARLRRAVLAWPRGAASRLPTSSVRARSSPARCAARRPAPPSWRARASRWCSPASAPPRPSARRPRRCAPPPASPPPPPPSRRQRPSARRCAGRSDADEEQSLPSAASLGPRGAGGLWIAPLGFEGRRPRRAAGRRSCRSRARRAPEPPAAGALGRHPPRSRPAREPRAASSRRLMSARERAEDEKSDEILKLSEALFAQDIELLRNNEKLGKIEKLKNDFIEKMSRELRTPLNAIIEAIITVLANENEQLSEPGQGDAAPGARTTAPRSCARLQNILDLWRIKQGELPVEPQEVNFREVVEEAIFSVQDTLEGKELEIARSIRRAPAEDPDRPRQGEPDPVPAARQRGQVHAARPDRHLGGRAGRPARLRGRGTPASASAPTTSSSSSTSSTRWTTWPRRSTAARASASRWCATC